MHSTKIGFCNFLEPHRRLLPFLQPPCYNALQLSHRQRFGLFRFRSPLLTESRFLSFPRGTEMFHFPRYAPLRVTAFLTAGFPHSEISRIKAWLRLPDTFRSNPRPSSPANAMASAVDPYLLDHITIFRLTRSPVLSQVF